MSAWTAARQYTTLTEAWATRWPGGFHGTEGGVTESLYERELAEYERLLDLAAYELASEFLAARARAKRLGSYTALATFVRDFFQTEEA